MKMLNVLGITLKGFKNNKEEVVYELGHFTRICGDNGQGKTTIGEAISWGLYGCNLNGNDKSDALLINKELDNMACTIKYEDAEGIHEISRIKDLNRDTSLKFDGKRITQTKLNEKLVSKEIFLSIFNPVYFPSLSPTPARNMLIKLLPQINSNDIVSSLDNYSNVLGELNLNDTNKTLKNIKAKLRVIEDKTLSIQGAIETKKSIIDNIFIPDEMLFDDTQLSQLKKQYEEVLSEKVELIDISFMVEARDKIENKLKQLDNDKVEMEDTSYLEHEKSSLNGEYNALENQLTKTFEMDGVCPCCGQEISENHKNLCAVNILDQMAKVESKISNISKQINVIESKNKIIHQNFEEKIKHEKDQLSRELTSINLTELINENKNIQSAFDESIKSRRLKLKSKIEVLENEKQKTISINSERNTQLRTKTKTERELQDDRSKLKELMNMKKLCNIQLAAIKEYNQKYVELLRKGIQQYLDKVSIVIQEITKDGEIKDAFELYYEGKEYKLLSASEKIRVGLEISNLIMNSLDISLPVFIDNAESITSYNFPKGQVIEAVVARGKKLTIES